MLLIRATIVTVLAALLCASESAVVPARNKFTFLGKFTPTPRINDRHDIQQTSYYFLSQNNAGWSTANSDCKAFLGETASLASIETSEELKEIKDFFNGSDDTGSTYWTAGKFDGGKFVWEDGTEIDSSAPWDAGHPNTKTPVTRVLVYTVGDIMLRTDFQTTSRRYLCELKL